MTTTFALLAAMAFVGPDGARPFAITVVDEQTGRGVPLVELRTVNEIRYVTDSAGIAVVDEPGLMGQSVFFHVKSHGYEYPKDGFGSRGKAVTLEAGGSATLKVRRINIAERLYRVTGGGIYRDSVLAGKTPPIREPLLNGRVLGQDSVLMTAYRGKLYWFWGDTNRPEYPLGNFHTPGATSELPGQGGLDPERGVDLTYFVDEKTGFARPTAELPGAGPTWLTGLAAFRDEQGTERLVAGYTKVRPSMETYEHGLVEFDPEKNAFEKVATFPLDSALRPEGHTFQREEGGVRYIYYGDPFPLTRVRARMDDLKDVTRYEGFSPLVTGSGRDKAKKLVNPQLDPAANGRPAPFAWRANTAVLNPHEERRLIHTYEGSYVDLLVGLLDVDSHRIVEAHRGSVRWNAYRKRWVMIAVQAGGTSYLGEVWFAEADTPLGPWYYTRKIVTHEKYSFYNPVQHPEFDKDGGRVIFFEGTYTTTFSGNDHPTPRYDYNQVMYRLDLADERLNLPVAFYAMGDGTFASGIEAARAAEGRPPAFFAMEKPGPDLVAVYATGTGLGAGELPKDTKALFHAMSIDAGGPGKLSTIPLSVALKETVKGNRAGLGADVPRVQVWPAMKVALPVP